MHISRSQRMIPNRRSIRARPNECLTTMI